MNEAQLVSRLERLERDNRRLKRTTLAALVLVAAAIGIGAAYATPAVPQKITAREFDVVDSSGKVRVRLSTQANGWAGVQVLNTAGIVQANMGDDPLGPSVTLGLHEVHPEQSGLGHGLTTPDISIADTTAFGPWVAVTAPGMLGGPTASIGVTPSGRPNVTLLDSKGHDRADISLDRGSPSLSLYNEDGREAVRLMSAANAASLEFIGSQNQKVGEYSFPVDRMQLSTWGLYFDDRDGTSAISLGGLKSGVPRTTQRALSLFDAKGTERASIHVLPTGAPNVELSDSAGYSLDLGSTSTIIPATGATQQTSAASIVMFGNDKKHHVIWQAP